MTKILLVGGGTGGPVMPLVAVQQKIKEINPDAKFLLVGTDNGPEKNFAEKYGLPFVHVPAGKLRRYFSVENFFSPFLVIAGFFKALQIIKSFNPDVVFGAGGYVSVPVVMAAWILRKKIVIHQQDVQPSLTNQLIAPLAARITVSFQESGKDFRLSTGLFLPSDTKVVWTGNPVREDLLIPKNDIKEIKKSFGILDDQTVILFLGGATGALALNRILLEALPELTQFSHVIHSTGKGKAINYSGPNYHPFELIPNMDEAYAIADIVISRAGLSTITELAALKKVSIIIPMPETHQESNALLLNDKQAAVCLDQKTLTADYLISIIRKIMYDSVWQKQLKDNIHGLMPKDAAGKIADLILKLCR